MTAFATLRPAGAQTTNTVRSTKEAYGVRLNANGEPADLNPLRVNNRLATRVNGRLDLRVQRYRVNNSADPTAAYRAPLDDGSRRALPALVKPPPVDEDQPQ
ncbi:hypothetical protein [uncultured Sphingomonas sp.]|uniref:hypothetical protein n=1 Tax=uncultured Sphingomonas sp. TaxID=158754 RepID=UPI0035CA951B